MRVIMEIGDKNLQKAVAKLFKTYPPQPSK